MASLPAPGSGGGSSTNSPKSNGLTYTINTNGLWLAITNVSNGWSYLNLHNGTNQVYAIWSTTNLLAGWQVETEVWPTNGKVTPTTTPFTVATLARQNLFLQAEDWTGVTENGNTTPEWWFWANFGTIALSDTNLDSSGNTLLFDFQNGINPNMNFTVNLGNQHFNMTTPVGTFFVLSGTPGTEAVLVNSTNFNSAVWQPYDGNVKMSLGPTDGVYQVWMGLKGSAPGSQPAWINRTVYLDRVAPKVTITNPTNSTTSQPMIQIQGYAGKPLSQITLKNAAGVFTNQTGYGYVTNQFFDTNLLAFTTNYFQCFDVPLTNGVNSLTIFATDLAGNTTAVTTNYTLNLSGDHTPPVLSIIWPQSGTFISGQTFTLQASMDDNTAKATATMTDSFGKTNTVQALVERSGLIWAQNLPMSAGTNTLKLTATDAAGNVSTTNLTLIQSSVIVTMNPLTGVQFNQPYVTVYGTINTTAAQVYVNGIQAIVNANGTWSANSVPASPVGTAAFDVEVYGGTSQNVAGGGGLHANGLPGGTATGSEQFPNVQPATVGLMSYNGNQTYTISSTMVNSTWTDTIKWSYDLGGSYVCTAPGNPVNESLVPTVNGDAPIDPPWQFTQIPGISSTENVATTRGSFTETWTWNDQTATKVMIEPTGQTTPGQSTLYYVQACASELSQPPHGSDPQEIYDSPLPDYDLIGGDAPTWWYGDKPLPPQWLQIQNQTLINTGITNSDGSVWGGTYITGPVGMSVDVTPTATQVYQYQDYTFDVQAKPGLMLLDLNTGTNDTLQTNTVIVGQQINLLCRTVTANGPTLSNFQWTVPGNAISNYVVALDGSSALVATNFSTNNANVVFYWVAGASNLIVQCSATVNGKTVTAQAVFNIMSPLPSFSLQNQGPIAADTNNSDKRLELYFGQNIGTNVGTAIYLTNVPAINGIFYGAYFVTQIINTYAEENVITGTNICGWQRGGNGLDNQVRYGAPGVGTSVYFSDQLFNNPIWTDSPDVGLGGPVRWVSRSDSFKSYLMFQPTPPSIAVPMYVGTWGWSGSAKTNGATGGILLSHSQIALSVLQTTTFPTWTMVNTNDSPWSITNLPAFNEN